MKPILTDSRHWFGWLISAFFVVFGVILTYHLLGKHEAHTPFWIVLIIFIVAFVIIVIVDVIKHYTKLQ